MVVWIGEPSAMHAGGCTLPLRHGPRVAWLAHGAAVPELCQNEDVHPPRSALTTDSLTAWPGVSFVYPHIPVSESTAIREGSA